MPAKKEVKPPKSPIPDRKEQKRLTTQMLNRQKLAEIITSDDSPKKCPIGTIRRPAYLRTSYNRSVSKDGMLEFVRIEQTVVPASCIKDQGRPGVGLFDKDGKRVFVHLPKEVLGQYGYKNVVSLTTGQRHKILDKAYAGFNKNWLSLFRTLNYLAVLNKSKPELHKKLIEDRDYIRTKYGTVAKKSNIKPRSS